MQRQYARSDGEGEHRHEIEQGTSDNLQRQQSHAHQADPRVQGDAEVQVGETKEHEQRQNAKRLSALMLVD